MTWDELMLWLERDFGEAGPNAAETSCLSKADLALGYEHCVERIAPALEEEMGHGQYGR